MTKKEIYVTILFEMLWERENFSKGKEDFMNMLIGRRNDLIAMKENGCKIDEPTTERPNETVDNNLWL